MDAFAWSESGKYRRCYNSCCQAAPALGEGPGCCAQGLTRSLSRVPESGQLSALGHPNVTYAGASVGAPTCLRWLIQWRERPPRFTAPTGCVHGVSLVLMILRGRCPGALLLAGEDLSWRHLETLRLRKADAFSGLEAARALAPSLPGRAPSPGLAGDPARASAPAWAPAGREGTSLLKAEKQPPGKHA